MIEKLIYKFFNVYNKIFKENFNKKLDFQWSKKPRRYKIINKIIKKIIPKIFLKKILKKDKSLTTLN